jgi:excisionase family DNA binding protein
MNTTTESRRLYRVDEAAALLSVCRTRIYELMRSGQLRSVVVGRSRRVPSKALDEYVEQLLNQAPGSFDHDDAA